MRFDQLEEKEGEEAKKIKAAALAAFDEAISRQAEEAGIKENGVRIYRLPTAMTTICLTAKKGWHFLRKRWNSRSLWRMDSLRPTTVGY